MENKKIEKKVLEALEDKKYRWRTLEGIESSSGLSKEEVLDVIEKNKELIIQSAVKSREGKELYTTRKRYHETYQIKDDEIIRRKILEALEDKNYKWRTLSGVARSTALPEEAVKSFIDENENQIVQSTIRSREGEDLYTTRKHYDESSSLLDKVIGALKGRAR